MSNINLRAVAEARADDPLNTWPDHTACHARTLMGNFLQDYHCLRCHLEQVATERAKSRQAGQGSPRPRKHPRGTDHE